MDPINSTDRRARAIIEHSDAYKDRHGYRPRFDWSEVSTEAIEAAAEAEYMTREEIRAQREEWRSQEYRWASEG